MAEGYEVLQMLCAGLVYTQRGNEYKDIDWLGANPAITEAEFNAGFASYDAYKAEQQLVKANAKAALLDRLGITEAEAQLLLS